MVKWLYIIIFFILSFNINAQSDTTCFTDQEVLNISNHIDSLKRQDSLKTLLISEFKTQISYFKLQHNQDTTFIDLQRQEIALKNLQIDAYKNLYKISKPKWYNSKIINILTGASLVIFSSFVIKNTL